MQKFHSKMTPRSLYTQFPLTESTYTKVCTSQGYYDTMDAGMMDAHRHVKVMARDDDVINVAGHRLSTSALEEAVMEHEDVVDCAVVGLMDKLKGQVPLAFYVKAQGADHPTHTRAHANVAKSFSPFLNRLQEK